MNRISLFFATCLLLTPCAGCTSEHDEQAEDRVEEEKTETTERGDSTGSQPTFGAERATPEYIPF